MSGGRWNYSAATVESLILDVAEDPDVVERFPRLSLRLRQIASAFYKIERDLDWDLSDDRLIPNDERFQAQALLKLRE